VVSGMVDLHSRLQPSAKRATTILAVIWFLLRVTASLLNDRTHRPKEPIVAVAFDPISVINDD
jgi:hypothetical protein